MEIEPSWVPSKEAEGKDPGHGRYDIVYLRKNKMLEMQHEEYGSMHHSQTPDKYGVDYVVGFFFRAITPRDPTTMSVYNYTKDAQSVALVSGNNCEERNQLRNKIQELFNHSFQHQKYQTLLQITSLLACLQVFSKSLLNELANVYANPWPIETTKKDYKSRICINPRRKQFTSKSRKTDKQKRFKVLKTYAEITGYGRSAIRVPLHVLNFIVLTIQSFYVHCWKSINAKKPQCYETDVLDCNKPTDHVTVSTAIKESSSDNKKTENTESSVIVNTSAKNLQVNKASCFNGNTTTSTSTGAPTSSSNMDEIIREELAALAGNFGDYENANNISNNNDMLNEDSVPLEDLVDLNDSDFDMTDEEEYESDNIPPTHGRWPLPLRSPSPDSYDAQLRFYNMQYADYIESMDERVLLTYNNFQDESSESGEEFPVSPKPPHITDSDSDSKGPGDRM